jgi:HAD superfamily hydrolase (TIGR01509 family)
LLPRRLDVLIFDVDGTLAETEEAHRLSFNAAFAEAGLDWSWTPDLYRDLLKVTGGKERIRSYMERLKTPPSVDADAMIRSLHARKTELYADLVTSGETPFRPGIAELLDEARRRGVALAIATTTSRPNVAALLQAQLGPEAKGWFATMICGDEVAEKKPAPDVYLAALRALCVPADRAVAVEDSANGVRSARAAGLAVIAAPSVYSVGDDFSDATVSVTDTLLIETVLGWS